MHWSRAVLTAEPRTKVQETEQDHMLLSLWVLAPWLPFKPCPFQWQTPGRKSLRKPHCHVCQELDSATHLSTISSSDSSATLCSNPAPAQAVSQPPQKHDPNRPQTPLTFFSSPPDNISGASNAFYMFAQRNYPHAVSGGAALSASAGCS